MYGFCSSSTRPVLQNISVRLAANSCSGTTEGSTVCYRSRSKHEDDDKLQVAECQTSALGQTCPSQTGPGSGHHAAWIRIQFHRIIGYIGLEETFEGHLVQQTHPLYTPVLPSLIRDFTLKWVLFPKPVGPQA